MTKKGIELIQFRRILTPLLGIRVYDRSPYTGYISQVIISSPGDCGGYVDFFVAHGTVHFLPREGHIPLGSNPLTLTFPPDISVRVRETEPIWVELRNGDTVNSHEVAVLVAVREGIDGSD